MTDDRSPEEIDQEVALLDQRRAELVKAAEAARSAKRDEVLTQLVAQMNTYRITVGDIERALNRKAAAGKPKVKSEGVGRGSTKGVPAPIKYRGPNGETWTGRGLMPRWLAALVAQGQTKEAFAV